MNDEALPRPSQAALDVAGPTYESLIVEAADVNVVSTVDGRYRYASPSCERVFGWQPADLEGRHEDDLVHPDDRRLLDAARRDMAAGTDVTTTYRLLCADGSYRWTEAAARMVDAAGEELVVSTLRDITGRHQHALALEHRALTDPLTGVANRTVLMDRLHQALRRLDRGEGVLAVLYLDLDRFKIINDSLGHRVGDTVLLKLAERLTHHLRSSDTLARLGGDEFVIVAEDMVEQSVGALGDRIIEAGRQPFRIGEVDFVCTLSVGIAATRDTRRSAEDLLHDADVALYRAKERGRDRIEVFDQDLRNDALDRRGVERLLRHAIDDGRVIVEYQPIVDVPGGGLVGAEALVRISDLDDRLLLPPAFLEVAQHTGLLAKMDAKVLDDAIWQAAGWHQRFPGTGFSHVAVNVTARHLAEADLHTTLLEALGGHGVPPDLLVLEVSEQVLMEASNSAMTTLRHLRDAGVRVALDDFGTGYSSLSYLRQFPLDFLKIDRSYIQELERDERQRSLVDAVINLAHAFDLTVVAEGVESAAQLDVLRALDCDHAQGFLFARSSSPQAIDELLGATEIPTASAPA